MPEGTGIKTKLKKNDSPAPKALRAPEATATSPRREVEQYEQRGEHEEEQGGGYDVEQSSRRAKYLYPDKPKTCADSPVEPTAADSRRGEAPAQLLDEALPLRGWFQLWSAGLHLNGQAPRYASSRHPCRR